MSFCRSLARSGSRLASAVLLAALVVVTLPANAKTMTYVADGYLYANAWYLVLNETDLKARLVTNMGSGNGTYTDSGTEMAVTLKKPISWVYVSVYDDGCPNEPQYDQRWDLKQVLFRRVDGTGVNKGKSRVVEIGEITDLGGCNPGRVTPFGSASDEGYATLHRSGGKRDPMTDVVAGLTIAGFRGLPLPEDPFVYPAADVVHFESATSVRFQRDNTLASAAVGSDNWLVLDMPGFQRGYTRFSVNSGNGMETWLEAAFQDGKPQTVISLLMTKPLPGASFGTKAATARMWESGFFAGTNELLLFYLYRDFTGERVEKVVANGTETRIPITWRYEGLDVVMSRTVSGGKLSERRWTPLGRTGKNMAVIEQEMRTPPGGTPSVWIPPRVIFFVDRGAAYPPAP